MSLSLEKERKRLARYEEWHKAQHMNYPELLQQRKLVTALEQLEQAREALEYAENAMRIHGCSSMRVDSVLKSLKQQEVGK